MTAPLPWIAPFTVKFPVMVPPASGNARRLVSGAASVVAPVPALDSVSGVIRDKGTLPAVPLPDSAASGVTAVSVPQPGGVVTAQIPLDERGRLPVVVPLAPLRL